MQLGFFRRGCWVLTTLFLMVSVPAEASLMTFNDRAAFEAATTGVTTLTFEGLVSPDAVQSYPNPTGLMADGFTFRTSGTGPSGPGAASVYGALAAEQSPVLNTGSGAILAWAPPDQPGTVFLDVLLPVGKTAFATDIWAQQPFVTMIRATVNSGEATENFDIVTADRPIPSFFGVVSDANVVLLVRFGIPSGQTGLVLDNVSAGIADGSTNPIPEPAAVVLLGIGLACIACHRFVCRRPQS